MAWSVPASTAQLLQELGALPQPQRVKRMVELGKASRSSPQAAALLGDLAPNPANHGDALSRQALLFACLGSKNLQPCLDELAGSCKSLRDLAASVLADIVPSSQLPEVLLQHCGYAATASARPGKLLHLLTRLRRRPGRVQAVAHVVHAVVLLADPAAKFTVPMEQEGAPGAGTGQTSGTEDMPVPVLKDLSLQSSSEDQVKLLCWVLPFGNEQQVTLVLAKLEAKLSGIEGHVDLSALLRWHPGPSIEFLKRQHHTTRRLLMERAMPALMQFAPDGALALFHSLPAETCGHSCSLWAPLTFKFPERMLELLLTLQPAPLDVYSLAGYMQRAQAQRQQQAQQRAAAAATRTGTCAVPAAPTPHAGTLLGAAESMSMDEGSSGGGWESDQEDDSGTSWVAPTSVPSISSLDDDAAAVMSAGGEAAAAAAAEAGTGKPAGGPHTVFELSARRTVLPVPNDMVQARLRVARLRDAVLDDRTLLQASYAKLRQLTRVLRALPVERRERLFRLWVAWVDQQATLLAVVKASVAGQGAEALKEYELGVLAFVQERSTAIFMGDAPALSRWLPVACQVELVQALFTKPIFKDYAPARQLALELMARLPSERLLTTLQQFGYKHLWGYKGTSAQHGSVGWYTADGALPLLHKLSAAQQSALLLDGPHPHRVARDHALKVLASLRPCTAALAKIRSAVNSHWAAACKLLAASSPGNDGNADCQSGAVGAPPPLVQMPDAVLQPALQALVEGLQGDSSDALASLMLRTAESEPAAPATLPQAVQPFTTALHVRTGLLADLYQRWRAESRPPLLKGPGGVTLAKHLAQLAGPTSAPQHALYQGLAMALELQNMHNAYVPWTVSRKSSPTPYPGAYAASTAAGMLGLLPPDARVSLLLDAAADVQRLCHCAGWGAAGPQQPAAGTGMPWVDALDLAPGPGTLVKKLLEKDQSLALLADLNGEQVKQLCDALPGLWVKAPWVLGGLSSPDRVALLASWRATRTHVQDALARLLSASSTLPAATAATAATAMASAGGAAAAAAGAGPAAPVATPDLLVYPSVIALGLSSKVTPLLGESRDAVLRELLSSSCSSSKAGPVATAEEKAALDGLVRDVLLQELVDVPMRLLPPHVRAMLARARILRTSEKHHGPVSLLFNKVDQDLRYLTWREITEAPCFKDRLQTRDASERAQALTFLINAVEVNPELLPHLLTAMHHRRREQDDTRSRLLSGLSNLIRMHLIPPVFERQLRTLVALHLETIIAPVLPARHAEVPGLKEAALAAASRKAAGSGNLGLVEEEEAQRRGAQLLASLTGLSQVFRDALSARDLSRDSLQQLLDIGMAMLRVAPEWAAQHLALLAAHGGATAVPMASLEQALQAMLRDHGTRCEVVREAAAAAVEEATAGLPDALKKLPSVVQTEERAQLEVRLAAEAAAAAGLRPKRQRGSRQVHKGARAVAAKVFSEAKKKPSEPFTGAHDPLQEAALLQLGSVLLPSLMAAFSKRQDGLLNTLRLMQRWSDLLFSLGPRKAGVVDVARAARPALNSLLLALVEPVAALKDAAALEGAGESISVTQVAWFADQVMLHLPDHWPKLKHLMLPSERSLAQLVKPHVHNSLVLSWPSGRPDLLLPLLLENTSMPDVAAKAVRLLFQYHGKQVAQVVPQLLARDPTYIMLPKVFWFVVRQRQDLLPSLTTVVTSTTRAGETITSVEPVKGLFTGGTPSSSMVVSSQAHRALKTAVRGCSAAPKRGGAKGGKHGGGGSGGGGSGGGDGGGIKRGGGGSSHKGARVNLNGWSRSGLSTSLWLGVPNLSLRTAAKLPPAQQQMMGRELVLALQSKGTLDISIVRRLVKKLAALPALTAEHLISLLEALQAAPVPDGGATGEDATCVGREAMQDVVLSALAKLDNGSQAWNLLVEALAKGTSNTALAAIDTLLAADIRELGSGGTAATGASSRAMQLLAKMRQLPWQRPAVLRVVIKLLGQLTQRSAAAGKELQRLACYAMTSLKRAMHKDEAVQAQCRQVVTDATPAGLLALDMADLPLPFGKELHRSAHLQLLTTLEDHFALPEVQALFLASALAEDKEIANSAAFIPSKEVQRSAPGTVEACVKLFELLLRHPDKEVRVASIKSWASDTNMLRLEAGMPIVMRMLAIKRKGSAEARAGKQAAGQWFQRAIEEEEEAKPRLGHQARQAYDAMPMALGLRTFAMAESEDDDSDKDESDLE